MARESDERLDIYSEVRVVDSRSVARFFLAPPGLSIAEAKRQRHGRWYKTPDGARRGLLAHMDREARERANA
jgi:hypothetical protein